MGGAGEKRAMNYTVEMRRSPDITEEEVRRRLAACYRLLLDLAEKHRSDTPDDDCKPNPDAPSDRSRTDHQEPADAESYPGGGRQMDSAAVADDAGDR